MYPPPFFHLDLDIHNLAISKKKLHRNKKQNTSIFGGIKNEVPEISQKFSQRSCGQHAPAWFSTGKRCGGQEGSK